MKSLNGFSSKVPSSLVEVSDRILTSGLTDSDFSNFFETHRTIASLTEDIFARLAAPDVKVDDDAKFSRETTVKVKDKVVDTSSSSDTDVVAINTSMTAEQISAACKDKGQGQQSDNLSR